LHTRTSLTLLALVVAGALGAAQQASAPQTPPAQGEGQGQGRGQGRGGGRGGPAPLAIEDRTGFEPIFDGKSLSNWDGDTAFWKAIDGSIVGESTAENPVKENTFLVWKGGEPADFELKVELRMTGGNSGIQVRSTHLPAGTKVEDREVTGQWVLKGYQADFDAQNVYTGMWYEERARGFLARRGTATYVPAGGGPRTIGNLERTPDELKAIIKQGDWNHVHVIARGSTLINIVNGNVTAVVVDDDLKNRAVKGLIGFQIHTGPPMKVEFRNVALKKL
jgi:Domain of Unknown Function (DUF1080)